MSATGRSATVDDQAAHVQTSRSLSDQELMLSNYLQSGRRSRVVTKLAVSNATSLPPTDWINACDSRFASSAASAASLRGH
jgi:hypothetical protein